METDEKYKVKRINKRLINDNKIIKCKLITILKNPGWLPFIKEKVEIVNMIKLEAYFFFNQYILTQINNDLFSFDKNTLERSVLFVLNNHSSIRNKDDEYTNMLDIYNSKYKNINNSKILEYSNIKTITNPFNYISTEIMTSIINHCNLNFKRFQRRYIKSIIIDTFSKYNLKKPILNSFINCIINNVNNDYNSIVQDANYQQINIIKTNIFVLIIFIC